ncbi:hemolysin XhlA family protein [Heyndrickxia oleronia]|jgi:predicted  nucleic acid-binding Zn-ribbon protein|uniref:hemolysin XhlA family protein n=1 Tax=Heyndrickxia oleronia TaxID=38875 RepID=UPI00243092A2|nr:hemolysin XhlA family protein [Heyndrickxia oleronia]MCI1615891.1 hemolysin XhlA family protein [Heyndrickxia oleronia]MCI1746488.1 hemolysin XhlA family protein [Heyndrickxia oleronia]MCI1764279.1 hemolysin XhlA family protein [Heyndrickxia oleronia]
MEERILKLENEISEVKTRLAVAESTIKDLKEDIASIKSNTTWILRIVIGAVISSILGLIIHGGI